jgi:phage terminase small subunit
VSKKLNDRQKLFVKEYLKDLNATQAAIRAGYSKDTAHSQGPRLLENVEIKEAVEKSMQKRAEKVEVSADYVLKTIKDTIERCSQAVPVLDKKGLPVLIENEKGEIVPAYTFQSMSVLKGAELLGKHLKLFTEKMEHSGQIDSVVSVQPFDIEARKKQLKGET